MAYEVTFEATGFTDDRGMTNNEFSEVQAAEFTDEARAKGTLPAGVLAVKKGYIAEDDGQGDTDIHVFVSVTLLVDAATEAAAESFVPPEGLLNQIGYLMAGDTDDCILDLDEHSWEVVDTALAS
jgi:hypothetical protein